MNHILKEIFSLTNDGQFKILKILGKTIKFKNPKYFKKRSHKDSLSLKISSFLDSYQDYLGNNFINQKFSMTEYIMNEKFKNLDYLGIDSSHNYLNVLMNIPEWHYNKKDEIKTSDDLVLAWEIRPNEGNYKIIKYAKENNKKLIFAGDSFLRSVNTMADKTALEKYRKGISFTFDDLTTYFDATRPSRLELMLNDKKLIISDEQKERARKCIKFIIDNKLTKYNSQPILEPNIGRKNVKKILVVDQSYGDMSILKGMGSDMVFSEMLNCAIKENPDADIIIKTHPDTIAGAGGYYTFLKQKRNIYLQTTPINPISLIQYCDKVYVCTTQFGFEALMCNKEVHVYGMPFYAGWGLTVDYQKCERRTNKRSLEEIFYIAYIMYSFYVNPEKQCRCEIENAMEYLINLRNEYFKEYVN